jgi:hypothetical protein
MTCIEPFLVALPGTGFKAPISVNYLSTSMRVKYIIKVNILFAMQIKLQDISFYPISMLSLKLSQKERETERERQRIILESTSHTLSYFFI